MSEHKLQDLINQYPNYSKVFRAVLNWFITHPKQKSVSMELFYTNIYSFTRQDIDVAFYIMSESEVLKPIFRLIDEEGHKIGEDYYNVSEIPTTVDTFYGDKKDISDVFIVPYFELIS